MKDSTRFGRYNREPKSESRRIIEEKMRSAEFRANMKPLNK